MIRDWGLLSEMGISNPMLRGYETQSSRLQSLQSVEEQEEEEEAENAS